ncbi:Arc family DNA-binding protein [Aureimonas pseudogalii]|uniref:Arc-like DNA binding domain-containing protein n=1 Tax=Aureimonas pseudogalii TaxID=1744844 RepID=A0A7W6E9E5_9HYPH|nr:Arc family DNA-binding protein [Aureimonas pseudogalii]MBB3997180.1 hypothetical protein [Aureimonas pseudogalii]
MARDDPYFRLRIPEPLLERIKSSAEESHRSATAEILARLEDSYGPDDYASKAGTVYRAEAEEWQVFSKRVLGELQEMKKALEDRAGVLKSEETPFTDQSGQSE